MALNPRDCTCGGVVDGYPYHESFCGNDVDPDAGELFVPEYDPALRLENDPWEAADRARAVGR